MKVEIENVSPIKKKLKFELPYQSFEAAVDKAYQDLNKKVSLKGFRKGKAPLAILKKEYAGSVENDVVSKLLEDTYHKAVSEHRILAVHHPHFGDLVLEAAKPITFHAEIDVQPEVVAKHYEGMKLSAVKVEVKDEEVNQELEHLRSSLAQQVPASENDLIQKGDVATIAFTGKLDADYLPSLTSDNAIIEVGLGQYLPDFEAGIVGMKKGEVKTIDVTFPENYQNKDFANKTAHFDITIKEHKRKELPPLDDEFAKDLGKFTTLAEVKEGIVKRLSEMKEKQANSELFNQCVDQLIEKNSFEIPESMVDRELQFMLNNTLRELQSQGVDTSKIPVTFEKFKESSRDAAVKRIKGFLLLDAIAKEQKLEIKPEDVNNRFNEIAAQYNQPMEVVRKYYVEQNLVGSIVNQLIGEKVFDYIKSKAKA